MKSSMAKESEDGQESSSLAQQTYQNHRRIFPNFAESCAKNSLAPQVYPFRFVCAEKPVCFFPWTENNDLTFPREKMPTPSTKLRVRHGAYGSSGLGSVGILHDGTTLWTWRRRVGSAFHRLSREVETIFGGKKLARWEMVVGFVKWLEISKA